MQRWSLHHCCSGLNHFALLSMELDPNQPVSFVNPVLSSMQTGTGGHDDAKSDRYDPSTWREAASASSGAGKASSARGCRASWHGKLSVVADTQRFLEQLQRRQQASCLAADISKLHLRACRIGLAKAVQCVECNIVGTTVLHTTSTVLASVQISWP